MLRGAVINREDTSLRNKTASLPFHDGQKF